MSATAQWAPVAAAAVGAAAALGAAVLAQQRADRREDKRWAREREDRREQWERERQDRQEQWQREDSLRWLQDRQQAYARLLAALDEWDTRLRDAYGIRRRDAELNARTELDTSGIEHAGEAARSAIDSARFMGSKDVEDNAIMAWATHASFPVFLEDETVSLTKLSSLWAQVLHTTDLVHEAMRSDLGIETARTTRQDDPAAVSGEDSS